MVSHSQFCFYNIPLSRANVNIVITSERCYFYKVLNNRSNAVSVTHIHVEPINIITVIKIYFRQTANL